MVGRCGYALPATPHPIDSLDVLRNCVAITIAVASCACARAYAESPRARPMLIADVGFGSAIGLVGLAYTQPLPARFHIELGAGIGVTGDQLAAMTGYAWYAAEKSDPVFGKANVVLSSAIGISVSLPRAADQGGTDEWINDDAVTAAVSVGWFVLHVAGGATAEVHGDSIYCPYIAEQCRSDERKSARGVVFPQLRFGFGVAF